MKKNTIFDLQQSKEDSNFLKKNVNLELDVLVNIIENVKEIPYLGSLFKLGNVALNYIDYKFICKLSKFMSQIGDIPEDELMNFINKLSIIDKKRISDYLTQLLYTAEEEEKAEIMAKIYKKFVYGEIDSDMMLRLCSIVNRAYITDLKVLGEYKDVSDTNTYVTDNLVALGVLSDSGNVYEESNDGWESTAFGPTKHSLNEVGIMLYHIIEDLPISPKPISQIENKVTISPINRNDINNLFKK